MSRYSYKWHGSNDVLTRFGGEGAPDHVHLGTLEQAAMRSGNKNLHLVRVEHVSSKRVKDRGSDNKSAILRAKKEGFESLEYLNRYEGIDNERLYKVLDDHPGKDLDKIPDREFKKLFPEAKDSILLFDTSHAKIVGCFPDKSSAISGYLSMIRHLKLDTIKPRAWEVSFSDWIRIRNPRILSDDDLGPREESSISIAREKLDHAFSHRHDPYSACDHVRSNEIFRRDGIKFLKVNNALLAVCEGKDELRGGVVDGLIYVLPEHRREGIARSLHICIEQTNSALLMPTHFSEGGFEARRSAHRQICEIAFAAGEVVLSENLDKYGLSDPEGSVLCGP